ncbi:MAG: hypothetical protein K1X65_16680 [Caldilineales bacterium]|nr:hypothetical protein [Caldilineales bacterium]MCW5860572.1 hypothetical protein [Caldilineales bacterium]
MSQPDLEPKEPVQSLSSREPAPNEDEIVRLRLAVAAAKERLAPFEQRYGVSSEYFMAEMAAEDLEGGDDEYVQWAGEWRLLKRLEEKSTQ